MVYDFGHRGGCSAGSAGAAVSGVRKAPPAPAAASSPVPSSSVLARLKPGPSLPREAKVSNQRARLCLAMIELVCERGYSAVTVEELRKRAGVSKHTVYQHFAGKQDCFLYTYELIVRRAAKRVVAAQKDCGGDWRERLRVAFLAFTGGMTLEPQAAQLALVECFAAGPLALERMRGAEAIFEAMIEQSFAHAPDAVAVPRLVVKGIVAGVARVCRARLLAGRAHELPDLACELMEWGLCYRCQAATALGQLCDPHASLTATQLAGDRAPGGASGRVPPAPGEHRARILNAVARLAAQEGYGKLTVPRIRIEAGVSRKSFDAHFEDVQSCFVAALEQYTQRALERAAVAGATGHDWPSGLYRAIAALMDSFAGDPVFARIGFVEVFAPGPDGMLVRERVIATVAESLRASAPDGQRPSELAAEATTGAVWGVVHHHVAAGRSQRLAQITAALCFLALAPAIGAQGAIEAITAEQARMREPGGTAPLALAPS